MRRKSRKRKRVQNKGTLTVEEGMRLTTVKEFDARSNGQKYAGKWVGYTHYWVEVGLRLTSEWVKVGLMPRLGWVKVEVGLRLRLG
jgi:hypothetical protein